MVALVDWIVANCLRNEVGAYHPAAQPVPVEGASNLLAVLRVAQSAVNIKVTSPACKLETRVTPRCSPLGNFLEG